MNFNGRQNIVFIEIQSNKQIKFINCLSSVKNMWYFNSIFWERFSPTKFALSSFAGLGLKPTSGLIRHSVTVSENSENSMVLISFWVRQSVQVGIRYNVSDVPLTWRRIKIIHGGRKVGVVCGLWGQQCADGLALLWKRKSSLLIG